MININIRKKRWTACIIAASLCAAAIMSTACSSGSTGRKVDEEEKAANTAAEETESAGTVEKAAEEQAEEQAEEEATAGQTGAAGAAAKADAEGAAEGDTAGASAAKPELFPVTEGRAESILEGMTQDEKISQLIIPAIRTWEGENVTDLSAVPDLAKALRKHQYGGLILFGSNVAGTEQVYHLVNDLQVNNGQIEEVSTHIPYFMPVDEEGGVVTRLTSGTRMTGSMAVGATGDNAVENAEETGRVIGEELAALGFNVDFAPDIDVNNNAANPVIGTRSFSDDPEMVSLLGNAFVRGLAENRIIGTGKHFPGHGDTTVDSHIGTPSVEKTYDEIQKIELVPFQAAIDDGIDMIMTAHITYPLIDEEVTFGDGQTTGFYPATMSPKIITEILRGDMGYDGVVVTDALEMDAIRTAGLVPGEVDSTEYRVNIAEKVLNAGVDILLIPADLNSGSSAEFYDRYIAGLEKKVEEGAIQQERIDESVLRVLRLKEKYGILDMDLSGVDQEAALENALNTVGSDAHHEAEQEIAQQAMTLIKNENGTLPVTGDSRRVVIIGRQPEDDFTIQYAVNKLQESQIITEDMQVTVDYYYDLSQDNPVLHYPDELQQAVAEADVVIALTKIYSLDAMSDGSVQYQAIRRIIDDTHAGGGRFVLLSDNLPYDSARFTDADAILLAYMGAGLDMDPTEKSSAASNMGAFNANVVAAIETIFDSKAPTGKLPVNIPELIVNQDGSLECSSEFLFERGFGLTY